MVSCSNISANRTIMGTLIQILFYNSSAFATNLRSASWIYCHAVSTSIFRFVLQHRNKYTPRGIVNMFLQIIFIIFNHLFHLQIFVGDKVKSIYQFVRKFVLKIIALFCNFSVKIAELFDNFFTFPFGIFALDFFKFGFRLFQVFRIGNFFSITQYCKVGQSQVNTDGIGNCFLFGNRISKFAGENNIPLFAFLFNSAGFNLCFIGNLSVKFYFYKSYFRKFNPSFVFGKRKSALNICKGIVSLFRFESWESRFICLLFYSSEKVFIRFICSAQNILQNLAEYLFVFGKFFFKERKFVCLFVVRNRMFGCRFVSIPAMLQRDIVKISAFVKGELQKRNLFWRGIQPIFVTSFHHGKYSKNRALYPTAKAGGFYGTLS